MNTSALIGIGILVYLLLKHNSGSNDLFSNLFGSTQQPTTQPTQTPVQTQPTQQQPTQQQPVQTQPVFKLPTATAAQLLAAAGGLPTGATSSSDVWCYYYSQVTGVPCPSSSVIGDSMTADAFLVALANFAWTGQPQAVPTGTTTIDPEQPGPVGCPSGQCAGRGGFSGLVRSPQRPPQRPVVDLKRAGSKWTM